MCCHAVLLSLDDIWRFGNETGTQKKLDFKELIYKYKHFSLVSLYGFAQIFFQYCERTVQPKYIMYSHWITIFHLSNILLYRILFWFIYMGIGFLYLGLVSKKDYYRLCIYMFGGMYLCYILYLMFPNGQQLRPVITENDIFSRMIKHIYATDTPTNVAPSIHVYNSIAVHVALIKSSRFKKNRLASLVRLYACCSSALLPY